MENNVDKTLGLKSPTKIVYCEEEYTHNGSSAKNLSNSIKQVSATKSKNALTTTSTVHFCWRKSTELLKTIEINARIKQNCI